MAQSSTIEWTDTTWNPVIGCSKVSEGCRHCYAERMANRLSHIASAIEERGDQCGRTTHYLNVINKRGQWNGKIYLADESLDDPYSWRSPRTVFVNSMSDLFHERVPLKFIKRVFHVMNECPQHTFQVLTKRPQIAAEYSNELNWTSNIWMGTSVEDSSVTERIHDLRRVGAHVRFLSVEPLLGPIPRIALSGIHWVIVGGESGPGARKLREEWIAQIRDRCVARGVPFFFKQWGGVNKKKTGRVLDGRTWDEMPELAAAGV